MIRRVQQGEIFFFLSRVCRFLFANLLVFHFRDYKYGVVAPDTSGWNVVTSSETSNDGKTHMVHSLATTGGLFDFLIKKFLCVILVVVI